MTDKQEPPTVELYVRSLAPSGTAEPQLQTLQRLEQLAETGAIERFDVQVVGRGILHERCCLATEPGQQILDRLDTVESWATANDAVVPGIDTVTVDLSPVHDRAYAMTTIPNQLLLEYVDDELSFVTPATFQSGHLPVAERLDQLAIQDTQTIASDTAEDNAEHIDEGVTQRQKASQQLAAEFDDRP